MGIFEGSVVCLYTNVDGDEEGTMLGSGVGTLLLLLLFVLVNDGRELGSDEAAAVGISVIVFSIVIDKEGLAVCSLDGILGIVDGT